jgi:chromate transporter
MALMSLFVPGLLLSLAALSVRSWLAGHAGTRAGLAGVNAAVVGVLAATLISPVATSAIHGLKDLIIVLLGLLALQHWHVPPIVLVGLSIVLALSMSALP